MHFRLIAHARLNSPFAVCRGLLFWQLIDRFLKFLPQFVAGQVGPSWPVSSVAWSLDGMAW